MENREQKIVTDEILQGMELAKLLRAHLGTASSLESKRLLVQKILSSYEKAILILNGNETTGKAQHAGLAAGLLESPLSINGSPRDEDYQESKNGSKKRKASLKWTDQVRVSTENMLEGPREDGYSWRKYGQKDILGTTYPRSYYRCTYKNSQNCAATKQVQRSDEDPTVFDVTYKGKHSCSQGSQAVPPPTSPEKQEDKLCNHYDNDTQQEMLLNFRKMLKVNTEGLDNKEMAPFFSFPSTSFGWTEHGSLDSFSPSFMSPETPELNCFSATYSQRNTFGEAFHAHCSESDLTGLISANTSATNSPIMDHLDFSLEPVELDPYFPFDTPGLFS